MPQKKQAAPFDVADALLAAYAVNQRINEYMIRNLPAASWRSAPPGGKGRQIAAIVAHMHNVRLMWLKAAAADAPAPPKLDPAGCTQEDAIAALRASHQKVHDLLAGSLKTGGRIKGFKPDAAGFVGYLISHDAHHRGQIAMLARQSGHPLSQSAMFGMWEWGSR